MQKLSSHLDVLVFSIALGEIGVTAALLEEIGGMYIPMNLSTSLFLRRRNYLNLLLMLNSPRGSTPQI